MANQQPTAGAKIPVKPPILPTPAKKCEVVNTPDGSLLVQFTMDPQMAAKLKVRAQQVPLERYLWENILYRALCAELY